MKTLKRMILFIMALYCLFSMIVPASAEDLHGSYGVVVNLECSNSEDTGHDLEDFSANVFLLSNEAGHYAVAKYDYDLGAYLVTGFTRRESEATCFRCGNREDWPRSFVILGLPKGRYLLAHMETAENYILLKNPVDICISEDSISVNGADPVMETSATGTMVASFQIVISKGAELPIHCMAHRVKAASWLAGTVALACGVSIILLVMKSKPKG